MKGLPQALAIYAVAMALILGVTYFTGCNSIKETLTEVKLKSQELVVLTDRLAAANEVVVRKLCTDPASVTASEKEQAVRIAQILALLTGRLREVWVPDSPAAGQAGGEP